MGARKRNRSSTVKNSRPVSSLPRPTSFFSSRRRHTRCHGDWSSDVCSSDLVLFSGVSVVKDGRQDDHADPRRTIAAAKHEPKDAPKEADEVSDTAPTLVPPRPSGTFPIRLRLEDLEAYSEIEDLGCA